MQVRARVSMVIKNAAHKPRRLRYFRRAMSNMLSIALNDIAPDVQVGPETVNT